MSPILGRKSKHTPCKTDMRTADRWLFDLVGHTQSAGFISELQVKGRAGLVLPNNHISNIPQGKKNQYDHILSPCSLPYCVEHNAS